MLRLETAGLGAHLRHGNARRIVDVNRRLIQFIAGIGQLRPLVVAVELARAQLLRIDVGDLAQQTLYELLLRHFQGKEGDGLMLLYAYVLGDIQGKGRLPHARTSRDED